VTTRPLFTPGKEPAPIVQEAGWAPGPVWTGAENLAPTGIRTPDRPARSQSTTLPDPHHIAGCHNIHALHDGLHLYFPYSYRRTCLSFQ